ncbi:MAG: hypothetical protein R3C16_05585 [Hyphomonadaceae bacterium]
MSDARVLIVFTTDVLPRLIRSGLQNDGWTCDAAAGVEEGLAMLRAGDHEVAIIDSPMPDSENGELAAALLAQRANLYLVVCVDEEGLRPAGDDPRILYRTKPIDRAGFSAAVSEACTRRAAYIANHPRFGAIATLHEA